MNDLKMAAKLITTHLDRLNISKEICPCCGVTKYEDFNQFQKHKELTALVQKLQKWSRVAPTPS